MERYNMEITVSLDNSGIPHPERSAGATLTIRARPRDGGAWVTAATALALHDEVERLRKELDQPSALHRDLLQLARDFGFQGEEGVWAWFRDRLQERIRFRARLDLLAEEMRKP